jgi:tRNA G18 (ribose-2'-O)-methylase SpoU
VPPEQTQIHDPSDPRLRDYANLTDAQLRDADWTGERGVFIAEGELVVRRLIASRFPVRSLLVTESGLERIQDALNALPAKTPVFVADQQLMAQIVGFPFHRGLLACGHRLASAPLDDLLTQARTLVVLEELSNADNVGAIFRNAGALAGPEAAVVLSPGCCDPLYRKSLRVSMGQALRIPFTRVSPWPDVLGRVTGAGFQLLALTPDSMAQDIHMIKAASGSKLALLLGAEGPGLTEAAFRHAAVRARIPMAPGADSLNVATAAAVALALLAKQSPQGGEPWTRSSV